MRPASLRLGEKDLEREAVGLIMTLTIIMTLKADFTVRNFANFHVDFVF